MFGAFLIHSLLCGSVTLVYCILRKLLKASPTICYVCDCFIFLYYAFPHMLISGIQITGNIVQIREREDVISLALMPGQAGETAALAGEFPKSNLFILMKIWCVVFGSLFIYICCKNLVFAIRMRRWRDVNHWMHLNWWKPPSDSSKTIPLFTDSVYTCSVITAPMFCGVVCPTIYFPEDMTEEKSICLISSHYEIHHKRKDILLKLSAAIISAVHWFNPFVGCYMSAFRKIVKSPACIKPLSI